MPEFHFISKDGVLAPNVSSKAAQIEALNPQRDGLWRRGLKQVIKVKWGHKMAFLSLQGWLTSL